MRGGASRSLTQQLGAGVFFASLDQLGGLLRDSLRMETLRANVWCERGQFTFDQHAPALGGFFHPVIKHAARGRPALGPTD